MMIVRNMPLRLLLTGFLLQGCEESLPPRNDPLAVVATGFRMVPGKVVIRDSAAVGIAGGFEGFVTNVFTEVLQDTEQISMVIDVSLQNQPGVRARVTASRTDVRNWWLLRGGILTVGPDTTLQIAKQWSHRTESNVWFWAYTRLTPGVTLGGEPYLESDSLVFAVEATVQGFKKTGPRHFGPLFYPVVYRIF